MSPDEYCAQKAAQSGSSFYYSFRFLPGDQRSAVTALYAFCREVDDVVDEVSDPGVARVKLAWWRTEVGAAFEGRAQHPVALALTPAVATFKLPQEHFQTVIDGMTMDLERSRYPDFATLERYCHCVAGVVGLLSAEIFGYVDPATRDYARNLGVAFQITNIIRDVGEDVQRGRVYLPEDELSRFGVEPKDLLARRASAGFKALMAHQVERSRSFYARALAALPSGDRRAQRPGLIAGAIYQALLAEIERDDFLVLDRRIALTPLRKAWIAWKTSWTY